MRMLTETADLSTSQRRRLVDGLSDDNVRVRRISAEAVGVHGEKAGFRILLTLLETTPNDDVYLRHTVRIALRNLLRDQPSLFDTVNSLSNRQQRELVSMRSLSHRRIGLADFGFIAA